MDQNETMYFDLARKKRDSAIGFFLDALIRSSEQCEASLKERCRRDEEVNVYLAHLLFAVSTPRYRQLAGRYLAEHGLDLMQRVERANNRYLRYFLYKINADDLLVRLGVFRSLRRRGTATDVLFGKSEEYYREAGRSYYESAADYHCRIYRKKTAVGGVLEKLAAYFPGYCVLLRGVRKEFFEFVRQLGESDFADFMFGFKRYETEFLLREKLDEFLDLYSEWLEGTLKDPAVAEKINRLCEEIEALDPLFHFRLPN